MSSGLFQSRLVPLFTPRVWLLVGLASMLLVFGSASVLVLRKDNSSRHTLYLAYDAVSRFMHDTVRLTLKTDLNRDAVFVAPVGILRSDATFNWVENYQDFKPRSEDTAPLPKAPERLLDPLWNPDFSGGLIFKDG